MPQHIFEDPTRFQSQLKALEDHKDIFRDLYVDYSKDEETVGGLRRRRRRAGNTPENPIKTVSLVERTLAAFESALGRRLPWAFGGHQLYLVPHAFSEANATMSVTMAASSLAIWSSEKR